MFSRGPCTKSLHLQMLKDQPTWKHSRSGKPTWCQVHGGVDEEISWLNRHCIDLAMWGILPKERPLSGILAAVFAQLSHGKIPWNVGRRPPEIDLCLCGGRKTKVMQSNSFAPCAVVFEDFDSPWWCRNGQYPIALLLRCEEWILSFLTPLAPLASGSSRARDHQGPSGTSATSLSAVHATNVMRVQHALILPTVDVFPSWSRSLWSFTCAASPVSPVLWISLSFAFCKALFIIFIDCSWACGLSDHHHQQFTNNQNNCKHHPWKCANVTCRVNGFLCKTLWRPQPLQHGSRCLTGSSLPWQGDYVALVLISYGLSLVKRGPGINFLHFPTMGANGQHASIQQISSNINKFQSQIPFLDICWNATVDATHLFWSWHKHNSLKSISSLRTSGESRV